MEKLVQDRLTGVAKIERAAAGGAVIGRRCQQAECSHDADALSLELRLSSLSSRKELVHAEASGLAIFLVSAWIHLDVQSTIGIVFHPQIISSADRPSEASCYCQPQ